MKFVFLCFSIFAATSTHALQENQVLTQVIQLLDTGILSDSSQTGTSSFYKIGYFETQNGLSEASIEKGIKVKIYYSKFGTQIGKKGSLVILPGRSEPSLKYTEVAYDFLNKGYSPIYAIDHRGQGFSQTVTKKTLPDQQIGHIENFDHYVQDFEQFLEAVVLKDSSVDQNNLFMLTNSMGGAIAVRYFQKNPLNPIKRAALSGSMIKIITDNKFPLLKASLVCDVSFVTSLVSPLECYDYTPGENAVSMESPVNLPDGRTFLARTFYGDDPSYDRNLTSSYERFVINDYIWNKWPDTLVGGPSLKWSQQALSATQKLRQNSEIKKIKTPIFFLIAAKDFRAEPEAQKKLCKTMGADLCNHKTYDAYHEILMEEDVVRSQAINDVLSYFETK